MHAWERLFPPHEQLSTKQLLRSKFALSLQQAVGWEKIAIHACITTVRKEVDIALRLDTASLTGVSAQ